jgi:hypothetical protein
VLLLDGDDVFEGATIADEGDGVHAVGAVNGER